MNIPIAEYGEPDYDPDRYVNAGDAYDSLYLPWDRQDPDHVITPLERVFIAIEDCYAGKGDNTLECQLHASRSAVRTAICTPDTECQFGGSYLMLEDPGYGCAEAYVVYDSWSDENYTNAQKVLYDFGKLLLAFCESVDVQAEEQRKARSAKAVRKIRNR